MDDRSQRTEARVVTDPLTTFVLVLKGSLLSSGGNGNLPSIHQDFITRHLANDGQFAASLAVGQIAPGPGGFWVVAFGYLVGGLTGGLVALVAVLLPPLLVLPIGHLHRRFAERPAVRGFTRGIVLAVAATVPLVFLRILGTYGLDVVALAIAAGSTLLIAINRIPVIVVIALGAIAGLLAYH
jgi:chromate transporter